jgi:hypothetical protein
LALHLNEDQRKRKKRSPVTPLAEAPEASTPEPSYTVTTLASQFETMAKARTAKTEAAPANDIKGLAQLATPSIAIMNHLVFFFAAITTFIIYSATSSHSIAGGDAGELVAEGCALGTAHPPGYPLYTLLVGAVVRLSAQVDYSWFGVYDLPTPAFIVNIMSCCFGAISSGLIASTVFRLTKSLGNDTSKNALLTKVSCAIASSIMWSFSPLNWEYNTEAEVFALHNMFVSAILFVLTVYGEVIATINSKASTTSQEKRIVVIGAFVCGLSLTNQHTSILLIIPVVAYVFRQSSIFSRPRLLMASTVAFLFGLSPYIVFPVLATIRPHAGSWGCVVHLPGFIHHLLRRDYGTLQLFSGDDSGSEGMLTRTASWANDLTLSQLCHPILFGFFVLGFSQFIDLSRNSKNSKKIGRRTKTKPQRTSFITPTQSNGTGRVMAGALMFYLGVFHSLSNLPLSNPLLFGIHQVRRVGSISFSWKTSHSLLIGCFRDFGCNPTLLHSSCLE